MGEVLDEAALLENLGGDWDLVKQVAAIFATDSREMLGQIGKAIADRDSQALCRAAHKLKGAVSVFSAAAASCAAQDLESMGRAGDLDRASHVGAELEREIGRVERALSELVARQGG